MDILVPFLKIIYGSFFCFAGIMHFVKPKFFNPFIPEFFPKNLVNYVVGVIEFILGLGIFFSNTLKASCIGIIILLIFLLPIHIWDLTKEKPAIGSKKMAIVRIPFQFILIYGIYIIHKSI